MIDENKSCPVCGCDAAIKSKIDDLHTAVIGNHRIGVDGLVEDMREIKKWRKGLEMRTAMIAGGITAIFLGGKALFVKIFGI